MSTGKILGAMLLAGASAGIARGDWTGWRGNDGLGVSIERNLPVHWSRTNGLAWTTVPPGRGASSPIVAGGRIWITAQTPDTAMHVIAYSQKDGSVIWDQTLAKGQAKSHQLHNMATPTPSTDGKNSWVLFGTGDVACLDADGKIVWHRELGREYGAYHANHGFGSSPLLSGGKLYVPWMHQGPSYVIALDAATGTNVWKIDRTLGAREEGQDSYSSPLLVRGADRTDLVVAGAEALTAYDPSTGAAIWSLGGIQAPHPYGRTIAGPAAGDGRVVAVASGFQNRGYMVAVASGKSGKLAESDRAWTITRYAPDCPTPVVYGGRVYTIRDDGNASCIDASTGEVKWQERLFSADVKVSPVAGDGKVYFTSGRANCVVVRAGDTLEVLGRNDLDETTLSTPTFVGGAVYLRTEKGLYAFRN